MTHKVDISTVQAAHAVLIQNGRYDLALTYMGPNIGWTVLRFDIERGCWYNPENRYRTSSDAVTAAMSAILLDVDDGYVPEWGSLINDNGVELICQGDEE